MRANLQSFLPGLDMRTPTSHGGDMARGKRKSRRPVDPKQALHVVLRSSKARGSLSMLRPERQRHIEDFTRALGQRRGVRIYRYANVGNHLHLLVKVPSRTVWRRFSRELAGGIALIVTGARKGDPLIKNKSGRGFWDGLAFTRIIAFGREFRNMNSYLIKNLFEGAGVPVKRLLGQGKRIITLERGTDPPRKLGNSP